MTQILLFSSVLGIRPGIADAVARLEAAGHELVVPDYLDGRVGDEYDPAMDYAWNRLGGEELVRRGRAAAEGLPDDLAVLGFSLGCVLAATVATTRPVSRVVLAAGAIPPSDLPASWPAGVPAQVHEAVGDPFRDEGSAERMRDELATAGAGCEVFEYPGDGHLFMDASLPGEYDAASAELFWTRVLAFLA
ncbi:MAG: dienelactone hydrolase family protein [Micrococcales bacterium]|nr:dienelactone hydrolase family protein [Micrococcales bacterium]